MKKIILFIFTLLFALAHVARAQDNRELAEDFVTASIVVTDPGDVLYSKAGHAFFRMQCPEHHLDFCFSYESEDVKAKVLTFLAGNLKMGLAAVRTEDYLRLYRDEQRGVYQYDLNLPIKVKQNLWRILDEEVLKGMDQPYDYLDRGCAISVLHFLQKALGNTPIYYGPWLDEVSKLNRRELLAIQLDQDPWTRLMVNYICNGSVNDEVRNSDKLVTPHDLVAQLQRASVGDRQLLSSEAQILVPHTNDETSTWFTPLLLSILLLIATLVCIVVRQTWWDYVLLAIQTLLGLGNVYLVLFSSLCATEWSWLLIPFNPLPLLAWKWRQKWQLPYAIVLVIWILAMCVSRHSLTDPAFVVLTAALTLNYLKNIII